ncbi:leucine-rich repeat serine/threonine-protein kinase 1-like [Physella acuta]|uniref:leucine-rich repeat serine/threonine-protein kinase 1-like n=1 Tax=Physella acuta TaxID=109671 RepID=UPI0027DB7999|nr:leucine-rich repeat serine/threonine-protein kinase 1-like [Physella acuta]
MEERTKLVLESLNKADQQSLIHHLTCRDEFGLQELKSLLDQTSAILTGICRLGFSQALRHLLDLQVVDINKEFDGKTCLQLACLYGHVDLVEMLMANGATVSKPAWDEDSELYLASLNGHIKILNFLLDKLPDLIKDDITIYKLMYAACTGGNMDVVHKWFSPQMDFNNVIDYVPTLKACELMYPLYSACERNHLNVAWFLIERKASITEELCEKFPEFTSLLVQTKFQISNLRGLLKFEMIDHNIKAILPNWFRKLSDQVNDEHDPELKIEINLSKNRISHLPDGVLWGLPGLTVLDISENPLRDIATPIDRSVLNDSSLTSLDVSKCNLQSISPEIFSLPCLRYLNLAHNSLKTLGDDEISSSTKWKCTKLKELDVCHNQITSLPSGIQACHLLKTLTASHNQIIHSCSPWQCRMENLDLSHNQLQAFTPSADQFWGQTLKVLKLNNNQLTEVGESIVRMCKLHYLDLSHNQIRVAPVAHIWCCHLTTLMLGNNLLGLKPQKTQLQKMVSLNKTQARTFQFPGSQLANYLIELLLPSNNLTEVPEGVCLLVNLSVLDLSFNPELTSLPEELGLLKKLSLLKLDGLVMKDRNLQALVTESKDQSNQDIIAYLERKYKKCVPFSNVKLVVFGCKNTGGHCLVQKLLNNKETDSINHTTMTITQLQLSPGPKLFSTLGPGPKRTLTFDIWEFPESSDTSAIQSCFLTLNSLYIIIHDVVNSGTNLHSVAERISSIQACVLRPEIIIVFLLSRTMDAANVDLELQRKVKQERIKAKCFSVIIDSADSVETLRQGIYDAADNMRDATFEREHPLKERQIPLVFTEIARKTKDLRSEHNICTLDEFLRLVGCSKESLEDGIDLHLKMHEYLLQVGALLNYNIYRGELSNYVFLNPTWLFNILSTFLKSLSKGKYTQAQLTIADVRQTLRDHLPEQYFTAFLHLLEAFNIGVRIIDNKKNEIIIVPSLLPSQPPQIQLDPHVGGCRAIRLYRMSAIPTPLWSHVISQLIAAFERFSTSEWNVGDHRPRLSGSLENRMTSFKIGTRTSLKGLHILNKNIQYWKTGIMISHDQGYVVVEEVECQAESSDESSELAILVIVQTTGSSQLGSHEANLKKLAVIGIVQDELEEILELFYPKFRDPTEAEMKPYALCPHCYQDVQPFSGFISTQQLHFSVRDCAQMVLWKEHVTCLKGPSSLEQLVPEFLFLELPQEFRISSENLILSDTKLGHGMAGAVQKGTHKGEQVAIKVFHRPSMEPLEDMFDDSIYPNVACFENGKEFSRQEKDQMETEQRKISLAFSDVRREVSVLSKLKHKCIVAFVGVCVRPQLLLVMELAPMGSLRSKLKETQVLDSTHKIISQTVFGKDLTYKILLQVCSGLSYLHSCNIIYRDLKPDNILVMSLDVDAPINVKLSDYGISKFSTLQGLSGLFGTPGYMAPEVMDRLAYTSKVDIYSFGIVMLEVLTGVTPVGKESPMLSKISKHTRPAHIRDYEIKCNFPYLENLMPDCWNLSAESRPTSEEIMKQMKADQFLLLHDNLWLDSKGPDWKISCIYACETSGRWGVWICECGPPELRMFSVYDVESSCYSVYRCQAPGKKVISMQKVGSKIWLACQELNYLEIIARGNRSKIEVGQGNHFQVEPLKILTHKLQDIQDAIFVLVGLSNGSVVVYYNPHKKSPVPAITTLELNNNVPISSICSVDANLITVACGMKIYFLSVMHESNDKGIYTPKISQTGMLCLQKALCLHIYEPIESMVAESEALWCSLEETSCLVKVDVNTKKVVLNFSITWNSFRDTVKLDEVCTNNPMQFLDSGRVGSESAANNFHRHLSQVKEKQSEVSSENISIVTHHKGLSAPPENAQTTPKPAVTSSSQADSEGPPVPPSRADSEGPPVPPSRADSVGPPVPPSRADSVGPPVPPSRADSVGPSVPPSRADSVGPPVPPSRADSVGPPVPPSRADSVGPPVPPSRVVRSLPRKTSPPPIPSKPFQELEKLTATSLLISQDVLVVGTNCGGIFSLPLSYVSDPESSPEMSGFTLQLPLLRHPASKNEPPQTRLRTKSSTSLNSEQHSPLVKSVAALASTDSKLVSLHWVNKQTVARRTGLRRNTQNDYENIKRQGSLVTLLSSEEMSSSLETGQSHEETNPGERASSVSQGSYLTSHPDIYEDEEEIKSLGIADIAIWDKIKTDRLRTLKKYVKDVL